MGCVVVTGAAGGIGQALVSAFSKAGYVVIGADLVERPEGLDCRHYLCCDLQRTVTDEGYAEEVFARIRAMLAGQPLDALVNNAAVQKLGAVEQLRRDDWRATLDVNLLAPFFWTQNLLPELEAAGGSVLNISSIHARLTKADFVAYATSKAALTGMTRAMAVELGARVRINAIEPAAIDTPMLRAGFEGRPQALAALAECHPAGGIGSPAGLAEIALGVVQSRSQFLNGSVLAFDGGISALLHDPVVPSAGTGKKPAPPRRNESDGSP